MFKMSLRNRLLKRQSSLAILVEQERETCESTSRPPSEIDQGTEDLDDAREIEEIPAPGESNIEDDGILPEDKGDLDDEGGDTDVPVSSEDENEPLAVSLASPLNKKTFSVYVREGQARAAEEDPPIRLSRRLMSIKRRGKALPMIDLTEEFEFNAGDFLTVRGEDNDFYVCRVLEDVPESASSFSVAWFNRVDDNVYEVRLEQCFRYFFQEVCECFVYNFILRLTLLR